MKNGLTHQLIGAATGSHAREGLMRRMDLAQGLHATSIDHHHDGAVRPRVADGFSGAEAFNPNVAVGAPAPLLLQDFIARQKVRYYAPHGFAFLKAREFVAQHLGDDTNPDHLLIATLYIQEPGGEPKRANIAYSMTLTDALMRNWQQEGNGQFFEHLGHLRDYRDGGYPVRISQAPLYLADCFAYEAIYRKTDPQRFDSSTQVAIDPKVFKRFVWEADLQSLYQASLKQFWSKHGADYHLLLKAALLKSAYVQHAEGSLSTEDKVLVLQAIGLNEGQRWETLTFDVFKHAPLPSTVTFRELVLYRYASTDIIVIEHEKTGRFVLYIPGNSSPLHGFKDISQLRDWIVRQCKDVRRRKALEAHFKAEDEPDGSFLSGLATTLAGLAAHPHRLNDATGHWWPSREITLGPALWPYPFSHFRKSLHDRLASDGLQLIRSRGDYNKEIATLALSNAIAVTGAVAMVAPYLWAPLAAMSLALTGLGIDEMVHGRTHEEKQQGAGRIVFGLFNAVPAAIEGVAAVSRLAGAAIRAGNEIAPGAADEVGQMIQGRSTGEQAAALGKQQRLEAQLAAEAREQAGESAKESALRLHAQELQRQALKAHREAAYDSIAAFGVEPEGLRSLRPDLRAELAQFEYNAPLESGGVWKVDDFGAVYTVKSRASGVTRYFARVHSKIYPVQRVASYKQYRIVSMDDTAIKGPYIKQIKGYYSDIDVKPGLRGGDSYIEVAPGIGIMPEVSKPDIVLAKPQPQLLTDIAMDGIEIRSAGDGWGNLVDRHFANGTPVSYDADVGCWRVNVKEVMWLNNKGVWKRGSLKAFAKARPGLNSPVKWYSYQFPRLPGYPKNPQAVERTVHQIWLGAKAPREGLIDTIKANIENNPELKFVLHIDIDHAAADGNLRWLQTAFAEHPNMKVSPLAEESFFTRFLDEEHTGVPFRYFREGDGQNLAAASDVLRYRLIREYGGIYMDCDDVIVMPFAGAALDAGPSDVLMGAPVSSPHMSYFGPGNSHFASQPGNPVLRAVEEELYSRFMTEREALDELSKVGSVKVDGVDPYMSRIFDVTGPRLLLDTLKQVRPDYAGLLDGQLRPTPGIRATAYEDLYHEVTAFYAPFGSRLKITAGAENSWRR
ncbi:dermonecrotic toxin domain-containing protein [Pseudomonas sp. LP_7_YM]|uniref:dermonecrotic toxin domain-containing protein n=1 Tax=Pseudomonas sp. LP_7_YM TaxID=2485137 RepID=UPI0010DEB272|nr:DUF6543 domain-containing protein [Pseudomonas sp. LP_7_YM]TDV66037.1 glycosyl transferase-like sugar-binding protein [Pseudomonas sp. LP_7_YM]